MKRVRQNAKRRSHNLQVKRAIRQDVRVLTDAVAAADAKKVPEALKAAISEIDRAVKKGTLHKNTAGRRKSQLTKLANPLLGEAKPKAKPAAAKPKAKAPAKKPVAKKSASK